jgi:hypothetical protein
MVEIQNSIQEMRKDSHSAMAKFQADTHNVIEKFQDETRNTIEKFQGDTRNTIEKFQGDTRNTIANLKNTMLITSISSVVAIVMGVAAFNATVLGNMLASFETGNHSAQALARMQIQQELNDKLHDKKLEDIIKQLERQTYAAGG